MKNGYYVSSKAFSLLAWRKPAALKDGCTKLESYYTLESGIDVGEGINVGPGKLDKKNKRRALNTHVLCSE